MTPIRYRTRWTLVALLALVAAAVAASTTLAASTAAKPAKAGIVLIDTNLGYEGGQAAGTGMVLTSSGEVLTNNHVIQGATTIRVVVPQSGRSYTASVVGYDIAADTAVLQLKGASGLTTVTTGDSSKLAVGQTVRAIGNAGGSGTLATAQGKVTGLGRRITAGDGQGRSEQLTGLIDTDAPLQPGDSGGPLLDGSGAVVGMDTAASTAGQGFYFQSAVATDAYAIPIATALSVAKQIEAGQSSATVHIGATAFLGISVAMPTGSGYGYGSGFSTTTPAGALVAGVVSNSAAARAGLAARDVITSIGGHAVSSQTTIVNVLLQVKPGSKIALVWTDAFGNRQTATITLASGPPQ